MVVLTALVMTCGAGKTTLAQNYDVLDADLCAMDNFVGRIALQLAHLAADQKVGWELTTNLQRDYWKCVLSTFEDNEVVWILLHSAETAVQLGAQTIYHVLPSEELQRDNIISREGEYKPVFRQAINDAYRDASTNPRSGVIRYSSFNELRQALFLIRVPQGSYPNLSDNAKYRKALEVAEEWSTTRF